MISAGNDIVALKAIDIKRTNQPAFYSKFITASELTLHKSNEIAFVNFVWLLWSVKESAYKYLKRLNADRVFSPIKSVVTQIQQAKYMPNISFAQHEDKIYDGQILVESHQLRFKSIINNLFIASIIDEGDVYWGVKQINGADYETQSKEVRSLALNRLNDLVGSGDLWIEKDPVGYPVIYNGNHPLSIPISFAHHDCYVSYAFQIPK